MNTYAQKAQQLYKDKKVLILGLGINQGGVGAARFFARAGSQVKVTDLKTEEILKDSLAELKEFDNISYVLGEHKLEDIDWADIVVRNPALKPDNQYLKYAQEKGKQIEMDLGIFMQFVDPTRIIGVTGTKGKSTTSTLIYQALKEGGIQVQLAGNIGKSMLDTLDGIEEHSFVILELSSFQLQALDSTKVSPKWAVITNIYPDHLNYHGTMEEYIRCKHNIAAYQTEQDYLFIHKGDEVTDNPEFLSGLKGRLQYFSGQLLPPDFSPKLPGEHNRDNIDCAIIVAETFGLDSEEILPKLGQFEGVEFRLQIVGEKNGVKIYNDTTATNPTAAVTSLKALPNSILIAGGMNKDLDFHQMAATIDELAKRVYFLEGDATEEIKLLMKEQDKIMGTYNNLEEILTDVLEDAQEGDVVLFSPGATSFNLFQNEFDRGRQFNEALHKVLKF
jgi:UDP-N-acetylmuramoylalanine--D-glutamate ligase